LTKGKKNKYKLVCKKIKNKITTSEMNALFEEAILTAPELYSWEYKKFKKPRTNSANIY
jgi:lauroyl/myristoyl acyltransferase